VRAYKVPTATPESDGTLQWDSTTLVYVEVRAGGETGIGFTYADADQILYQLIDERRSPGEIAALGLDPVMVQVIWDRVRNTQFKRQPPLIAKLSARSVGQDFRYPRDWGH